MNYRSWQALEEIVGERLTGMEDHFLREFCLEAPGQVGERTASSGGSCLEGYSAEILEKAMELMKVAGVSLSDPFLCRQALFED